ncbi:MAG TPA: hypothetical protein VN836_02545 [Verrucomicrobiae bacterium]|nr:hypothetical protein [Verrucomicrobiae bacterium]
MKSSIFSKVPCFHTVLAVVLLSLGLLSAPAQTQCVDTNVPKYLQPPNPTGYDVLNSGPWVLADDFICTNSGPITDIHIWGSWLNDNHGTITNFWLGIYDDVPVNPNNPNSHPGNLLWSESFPIGQFAESQFGPSQEQFLDPGSGSIGAITGTDTNIWYYCFYPTNPFFQTGTNTAPKTYWLAAYAQVSSVAGSGPPAQYGWKTTFTVQHDTSVHEPWPGSIPGTNSNWVPTAYQPPAGGQVLLDLAFKLETTNNPPPPPVLCVDTNGIKYIQPPNLQGLDVWNNGPWMLADDFVCTNSGPISDIHIWGSWLNNLVDSNSLTFTLGIYDDVPVNPTNTYSHPGNLLWQQTFAPGQYAENFFASGAETFLDPGPPNPIGTDTNAWYYCFYPTNPFAQGGTTASPSNYWLAVYAQLPAGTTGYQYGWKTTFIVQNDTSVHAPWPGSLPTNNPGWMPTLQSPTGGPLDLAFLLTTPTNCIIPISCKGGHPPMFPCGSPIIFDPPTVGPSACCTNPTVLFSTVTNFASCGYDITATWTILDCSSNIAGVCSEFVVVLDTNSPIFSGCVTNKTVTCGSSWGFDTPTASYVCTGSNAPVIIVNTTTNNLNGCTSVQTRTWESTNECSGLEGVGYPPSATCTEVVTIVDTNAPVFSGCVASKTVQCGSGWVFDTPTASYVCTGSNAPVGIVNMTTNNLNACTNVQTETWAATNACSSAFATCTEVVTVVNTNPPIMTCPTNKTVIKGSAWNFDPPTAVDACSGASVLVTVVSTVTNGSGPCNQTFTRTWQAVDACGNTNYCSQNVTNECPPVVCVESDFDKYVQGPNILGGFDVWNNPYVLADDFVCTNSGPISDIHLWGSWLNDRAVTNSITFWLGIYDDVPTNVSNPFSHPGTNLLWQQWFAPGQYAEEIVNANAQEQFLDPGHTNIMGGDSVVWYYCFYPTNAFQQLGTPTNSKTYWLAAYAQPSLYAQTNGFLYGWKTTTNVLHDTSVHAFWPGTPPMANPGWTPTVYQPPVGGPPVPLDLAFKLTMCGPVKIHWFPPTNVVVTWQGGGYLQSATNVTGPYIDVPGFPPSPYTDYSVTPTNKFYRLRCY